MAEYFDVATEVKEDKNFYVAGLQLPKSSLFTPESAARALTMKPQPNDVILSSYPKCDSRYVDSIVWKLLYADLKQPLMDNVTRRFLPCQEMASEEDLSDIYEHVTSCKLPKLYKTYFPFRLIPFYRRARYIYVIRSPWEACTSYYHFLASIGSAIDTFNEFFDDFMEGDVAYGSYFKHVAQWNKRSGESNILILCREHVEHNPRSAMFKIAAFLGDCYLNLLMNNEELEKDILSDVSDWEKPGHPIFKNHLPNPFSVGFDDVFDEDGSCHISIAEEIARELKKPVCSELQLNSIVKKISQQFNNSSLEFLWLNLFQKQLPVLLG